MHEVIEAAVDPDHGALGRPQGGLGGAAARPAAERRPHQPRDHRGADQAERRGGPQGHGRQRGRARPADARRHHLRAVPLDRGRLGDAGHRPPARRVGQHRPRTRAPSSRSRRRSRAAQKAVYNSWGPGRYDPRFNIDGKNTPVVHPARLRPARTCLRDLHGRRRRQLLEQLRGGDADGRRRGASWTPASASAVHCRGHAGPGDVPSCPRCATTSSAWPHRRRRPAASTRRPPQRGRAVFEGAGRCASCHQGERAPRTELHAPAETGDGAAPTPRAAPPSAIARRRCARLCQHAPYFHDGSARTLTAVVDHYDARPGPQADARAEGGPGRVPEVDLTARAAASVG